MSRLLRFGLSLFLLSVMQLSYGQDVKRFSSDPVTFIAELEVKYSQIKDRKVVKEFEEFINTLNQEETK